MSTEVMKLALEALKELVAQTEIGLFAVKHDHVAMQNARQAITALREELAQPQQEPVATTAANHVAGEIGYCKFHMALPSGTNLYTSPPARKPLTDEEIWKFWWARPEVPEGENDSMETQFIAAVRAVEAAHGIKETT